MPEGNRTYRNGRKILIPLHNCECIGICDYMEITEEAARIMKESGSDEIVYYSKELDMYIWGITHYGTSWKLMLTSIPIPEDNAA